MSGNFSQQAIRAEERRVYRLSLVVFLVCTTGIGLVFLALSSLALLFLSRETVAELLANFIGNVPQIGNALNALAGSLGLPQWIEARLDISAFSIGAIIGAFSFRRLSGIIAKHLFAPLDVQVASPILPVQTALEPLRATLSDDPDAQPLPWLEPAAAAASPVDDAPQPSLRFEVWKGLERFALQGGGRFEYQLLLGGPGAGKTRMSIEFARRILAKRSATGSTPEILHGKSNHDRLLTRGQRLRSWWRVRVLAREPGPEDIWHVGWFNSERHSANGTRTLLQYNLTGLAEWRPTCPTFLLLDDPLNEDAVFVVQTLSAQQKHYRHRVRLLIANQTIPGDLRYERHDGLNWQSQVRAPFAAPLVLSAAASLSVQDIRVLSSHLPFERFHGRYSRDENMAKIRAITRGNPLLVELAFAWLMDQKPLASMSEEALLEDRTRRFLQAIRTASAERAQGRLLDLLIMVTIAQGAPTTLQEAREASPGEMIWDAFGLDRIDESVAARLFPAETSMNLRRELPPLRPELIGIAFARMGLSILEPSERQRIIHIAWRANPRGTLRTLLRIDGGYASRSGMMDPLQSAFDAVPIEAGLPPLDVFRLLVEASCCARADDWEEGRYFVGAPLAERAVSVAQGLADPDLLTGFRELAGLFLERPADQYLRAMQANDVLNDLLVILNGRGLLYAPAVFDGLRQWLKSDQANCDEPIPDIAPPDAETLDPDELSALFDSIGLCEAREARIQALSILVSAYTVLRSDPTLQAMVHCAEIALRADIAARDKDASAWLTLTQDLARLGPEYRELALLRPMIMASRFVVSACDETAGEDAHAAALSGAQQIADLIGSYPADEALQLEGVKAWRSITWAHMNDRIAILGFAEKVEAIATRFPQHAGFQSQRALAWSLVGHAHSGDADTALLAAQKVEKIAADFPNHQSLQRTRAEAWQHVVFAHDNDTAAALHAARRVDEIAARFPSHEGLHEQKSTVWQYITFTHRDNPAAASRYAEKVEAFATPFPHHEGIQLQRAIAWCLASHAHLHDRVAALRYTRKVEEIAIRFPQHEAIQRERAEAWQNVNWAYKDDAEAAQRYAQIIDTIAAPFPHHSGIQLQRAAGWQNAGWTHRQDPQAILRFAEKVDGIVAPFAYVADMQYQRAAAWRHVVTAHRDDPVAMKQYANIVTEIAARFPGHEGLQDEAKTVLDLVRSAAI